MINWLISIRHVIKRFLIFADEGSLLLQVSVPSSINFVFILIFIRCKLYFVYISCFFFVKICILKCVFFLLCLLQTKIVDPMHSLSLYVYLTPINHKTVLYISITCKTFSKSKAINNSILDFISLFSNYLPTSICENWLGFNNRDGLTL